MFSSRFHWDLKPNRLTEELRACLACGVEVLDLTESNPTRAGLLYPSALEGVFEDAGNLLYEPVPAGTASARQVVADYYAERGVELGSERILLTASTSEGYSYLFKLLCNAGDEVLVPRPSYPLFEYLATMESVGVRTYPLTYDGAWGIDLAALEAALTPRTRAIAIVNPNNPTGSYIKPAELAALERLAAERGLALISDEVFSDYGLSNGARVETLAGERAALTFSMSGLSKIAGLPQMKLGWIAASGPEALRREAMEKLEWIADTYLSVSTPVQRAAGRLMEAGSEVRRQIQERSREHLELARQVFAGSAAGILDVEGGWYITLRVPRVRSEEEWALDLLKRERVLVQPGYFYDFDTEAFLVVSLLTAPGVFREGVARLRREVDRASAAAGA
jgi:alanine-synthesizing transaminase